MWSRPALKYHENIKFLSKTEPDTLENHKATKPEINVNYHLPASETSFKWHFAVGLMMVRL